MPESEKDKFYEGKTRKTFFKDEAERMLWIRLNAEHIRYFQEVVNHKKNNDDLGDIDKPYSHMWVSNNQLTYDEYMSNAPRFSFEELVLPHEELLKLSDKRNRETIKKMFGETFSDALDELLDDYDIT